jgi:plastocyanin domain-containing protein
MNDILTSVGTGLLGVIIYEIIKSRLKNHVKNTKILIPVSMILAIMIGTGIYILLYKIFS